MTELTSDKQFKFEMIFLNKPPTLHVHLNKVIRKTLHEHIPKGTIH